MVKEGLTEKVTFEKMLTEDERVGLGDLLGDEQIGQSK